MTTTTQIADNRRENRLRHMAKARGYILSKSRRRNPNALDYGRYWLSYAESGFRVFGGVDRAGLDLDDVEEWLTGETQRRWQAEALAKEEADAIARRIGEAQQTPGGQA